MSRIGKKTIPFSKDTQVSFSNGVISVKGPKGRLQKEMNPGVSIEIEDNQIKVGINEEMKGNNALQGLCRSLVFNMVTGVNSGFERDLEINGIGYRASVNGDTVTFNLGYSHPIDFKLPEGVSGSVDKNNVLKLSAIDKELLGQTAASIRRLRPPEPYKGKGIKYAEERIQRKAGKTGTK